MPRVNVEGFGIVNFDDAMTNDEIVYAIENDILKNNNLETDPYADERTLGGSVAEFAKGIPREFAGAFLSAGEGVAELADAGANALGFDDLIDSGDDNELVRLSREGRKSLDASFLGGDVAYRLILDTYGSR